MMNEIDDNFEEYEAAEIRSGADFSQLTADNFDKIERDDDRFRLQPKFINKPKMASPTISSAGKMAASGS